MKEKKCQHIAAITSGFTPNYGMSGPTCTNCGKDLTTAELKRWQARREHIEIVQEARLSYARGDVVELQKM